MNSAHQRHRTTYVCVRLQKGESSSSWAETQTLRVRQAGPAQSSNPACPSIPSTSLGTLNLQDSDHEGQTPASRCSPSPSPSAGGGRDPTPGEQTPLSGPRCSGRPGPAAARPASGCEAAGVVLRPLLHPRAQPRPSPAACPSLTPSAVAPPSVLTEADGTHRRRRLPSAPIAPRLPPAPPASPRARPPAPRRKPALPGPPPTLPAAANGPGQPRSRARPLAVEDRADAGVAGGKGHSRHGPWSVASATQSGLATWLAAASAAEWHPGRREKCVSAFALQSHAGRIPTFQEAI